MSLWVILIVVAVLGTSSFFLGRGRATSAGRLQPGGLHSLAGYYGWYAALWAGLPGLAVVVLWTVAATWGLDRMTLSGIPAEILGETEADVALFLNDVKNLASGSISSSEPSQALSDAAARYESLLASPRGERRRSKPPTATLQLVIMWERGLDRYAGTRQIGVDQLQ